MSEISIVTKGDSITTIFIVNGIPVYNTFPISNTNQNPSEFVYINNDDQERALTCANAVTGGVTINPTSQSCLYIDTNSVTTIEASGLIPGGTVLPIPTPSQSWEQFVYIDF